MKKEIIAKAYAKVNLTLNIISKRKDEYHDLESIFQIISLFDTLIISKTSDDLFHLDCNLTSINNNQNILFKTFYKLQEKYSQITGIKVILKKRIPIQSGLGGGSADAACLIKIINKIFNLHMTQKEIIDLGLSIGSDVIPCMQRGTFSVTGKGEMINHIKTRLKIYYLLVKPQFNCSTKEMYDNFDKMRINQWYNTTQMIEYLNNDNFNQVSSSLYNVFEKVINNPELTDIKNELIQNGAENALMTGSGSCVFGIFVNQTSRDLAFKKMKGKYIVYKAVSKY